MPYRYTYKNVPEDVDFACDLECRQCSYHNPAQHNRRCRRTACIGFEMCWQHLMTQCHLKIQTSTLPGAGKGLFAWDPRRDGEIIFRKGDRIVQYGGEDLTHHQIDARYGGDAGLAQYAIQVARNVVRDAACLRGTGSIANHRANPNAEIVPTRIPRNYGTMRAKRNIRHGQEIFISYGREYHVQQVGHEIIASTKKTR